MFALAQLHRNYPNYLELFARSHKLSEKSIYFNIQNINQSVSRMAMLWRCHRSDLFKQFIFI